MPIIDIHTHAYTPKWLPIWRFVMRYIAPSAIALISVMTIIDQAS